MLILTLVGHQAHRSKAKIQSVVGAQWSILIVNCPHSCNYPLTLSNYRLTDDHLRLVTLFVALCCTRQSRAPAFLTLTSKQQWCQNTIFGIWPWSLTVTYNPTLVKVKVHLYAENVCQEASVQTGEHKQNGQTDITNSIISLLHGR